MRSDVGDGGQLSRGEVGLILSLNWTRRRCRHGWRVNASNGQRRAALVADKQELTTTLASLVPHRTPSADEERQLCELDELHTDTNFALTACRSIIPQESA